MKQVSLGKNQCYQGGFFSQGPTGESVSFPSFNGLLHSLTDGLFFPLESHQWPLTLLHDASLPL